MLQRLENFTLPEEIRNRLDRSVLALGIVAFASGVVGSLL